MENHSHMDSLKGILENCLQKRMLNRQHYFVRTRRINDVCLAWPMIRWPRCCSYIDVSITAIVSLVGYGHVIACCDATSAGCNWARSRRPLPDWMLKKLVSHNNNNKIDMLTSTSVVSNILEEVLSLSGRGVIRLFNFGGSKLLLRCEVDWRWEMKVSPTGQDCQWSLSEAKSNRTPVALK